MSGVDAFIHAAFRLQLCCFYFMRMLRVGSAVVLERGSGMRSYAPVFPSWPCPPPSYSSPPALNNRAMGVGGSLGFWSSYLFPAWLYPCVW